MTRCPISRLAAAGGALPPVSSHSMAPMEAVSRKCPSRSQGGGVFVYYGATATFADCQIYSNTADTVSLCPHSIPWPHGRSVPKLTPCPWDAMPHQLTRRCSMYAAARYPPFHGPTWKKFPGSVPCARREVAWRSSTARPPSPTVRSLRTLHLSRYAAARYAPFHGPHGRSFQEVSHALAGRWRVRLLRHGHPHQL